VEPLAELKLLLWLPDPDLVAWEAAAGTLSPLLLLPEDGPLDVSGEPCRLAFPDYSPSEDGEGDSVAGSEIDFSSDAS
jgi:hypothetical protein